MYVLYVERETEMGETEKHRKRDRGRQRIKELF